MLPVIIGAFLSIVYVKSAVYRLVMYYYLYSSHILSEDLNWMLNGSGGLLTQLNKVWAIPYGIMVYYCVFVIFIEPSNYSFETQYIVSNCAKEDH